MDYDLTLTTDVLAFGYTLRIFAFGFFFLVEKKITSVHFAETKDICLTEMLIRFCDAAFRDIR